ncbi:TPA: FRG domain-containing protein, partial [Yersinia enterocolitica]|nr:FRG domain-containing protein [Yersinia enterocolitica]
MTNELFSISDESNSLDSFTEVNKEYDPLELNGAEELTVTSIEALLTILSRLSNTDEKILWFRGQADFNWELCPGFFRLQGNVSESTLLMKFKQSAAQLVIGTPKESSDWMFLMQHYGLPTRLLDWSESPLIGMYFAVEDKLDHDKDGSLWIINPLKLNSLSRIQSQSEDYFIPSFDDDIMSNYTIESVRSGHQNIRLLPVAILAARNNPRIQAQLGVFTVHHTATEKIEKVPSQDNHYLKIKIPSEAKPHLKKQLSVLGYSRFQIFPELASIADVIKENML